MALYIPLDADDEDQLVLLRNEERARLLSIPGKLDLAPLLVTVLLDVRLSPLEDDLALLLVRLGNC